MPVFLWTPKGAFIQCKPVASFNMTYDFSVTIVRQIYNSELTILTRRRYCASAVILQFHCLYSPLISLHRGDSSSIGASFSSVDPPPFFGHLVHSSPQDITA
jgi:hypothetical protein